MHNCYCKDYEILSNLIPSKPHEVGTIIMTITNEEMGAESLNYFPKITYPVIGRARF